VTTRRRDRENTAASPTRHPRAAVIVLAAGAGRRVGRETSKVLLPLSGLPVLAWSLRTIFDLEVDRVVVVIRERDRGEVEGMLSRHFPGRAIDVVPGGSTRHGSEWNALTAIADPIDTGAVEVVAIHDAARPLAGPDLFASTIGTAAEHGGALPVQDRSALVSRDPSPLEGAEASPREGAEASPLEGAEGRLVGVQTPQAFRAGPLLDAHRRAARDGFVGTDTASCVERYTDLEIHCVPSTARNLKITYPEDVALAEQLLSKLGLGLA